MKPISPTKSPAASVLIVIASLLPVLHHASVPAMIT